MSTAEERARKREYAAQKAAVQVALNTVPLGKPHPSRPKWYQRVMQEQRFGALRPPYNGLRERARRLGVSVEVLKSCAAATVKVHEPVSRETLNMIREVADAAQNDPVFAPPVEAVAALIPAPDLDAPVPVSGPAVEVTGPKGEALVSYAGTVDSIRGWARRIGIADSTLRGRIKRLGLTAALTNNGKE